MSFSGQAARLQQLERADNDEGPNASAQHEKFAKRIASAVSKFLDVSSFFL
jgi:hypothetical protein